MDERTILSELIRMSAEIGRPENDYVIFAEGNTSAKIDEDFFFIKASGKFLRNADKDTFVKVRHKDALAILDMGDLTDKEIKEALLGVCADPANKLWPSVETTFHSYLLSLPGVNFVAHTHASPVNSIMVSENAKDIIMGRLFPEEIMLCGVEPVYIPYCDPGCCLARTIRENVTEYMERFGEAPKQIMMQNHGVITLGKNADEALMIMAMTVKVARVLVGAAAFGQIQYLTPANVDRIFNRPDEAYRRQLMVK